MPYNKYVKLFEELKSDMYYDEPLKKHTSLRIGGPADVLIIPYNIHELRKIIKISLENVIKIKVIGNGSNLLVPDDGYKGVVIKIKNGFLNKYYISDKNIEIGAGVPISYMSKIVARLGLTGLEFGIGIPGVMGGAITMNAGCGGQEISQIIGQLTILNKNGMIYKIDNDKINFGYRSSRFLNGDEVILKANINLNKISTVKIYERMNKLISKRKKTQPLGFPSAGSTFKKPNNYYAGALIEQAGCKGLAVGDAKISEKHANFIINCGNAKCSDVISLMTKVKEKVYNKFNVILEPEIDILK